MRRWLFVGTMVVIANVSSAHAQCRGGGGPTPSSNGSFNPLGGSLAAGPNTALGTFGPLGAYPSQLAQQRYLQALQQTALQQTALQQMALQQMALQQLAYQQQLMNQRSQSPADGTESDDSLRETSEPTVGSEQLVAGSESRRAQARQRARRRNAQSVIAVADRAMQHGEKEVAAKHYRRVLKMLPESDEALHGQAIAALQELNSVR